MYVPPYFINTLTERLSIFDVVSLYVPLSRKGTRYYGCCPFHNEKTPSFHINIEKNTYICFGCKEFGNIFTFIQKLKGVDFITAIEILAQQIGLEIPQATSEDHEKYLLRQEYLKIMQAAQNFFSAQLESQKGKHAKAYLDKRKIGADIIKKFGLGYSGVGNQLSDYLIDQGFNMNQLIALSLVIKDGQMGFYRNRLMFPIYNKQKNIIAFGGRTLGDEQPKYINSAETPLYQKGENLYGFAQAMNSIKRHNPVIIVEGYIDVITMHQHGFDKTVAPLGTALTPAQIKMIWKISSKPIICFDGDSAGAKAAETIACNTLPLLRAGHSLQFATLPATLDPDDYLKKFGPQELQKIFNNAIPLSHFLWQYFKSLYPNKIPEEKAEWHELITEKLLTIEHDIIRSEYIQIFQEWGFKPTQQAPVYQDHNSKSSEISKQNNIYKNKKKIKSLINVNARPKIDTQLTFQKLLLSLPLYYSEILIEIYEYLSNINFQNKIFNNIRDVLLDYANESYQNEVLDLNHYLIQRGIKTLPRELSIAQNYTHLRKLNETPTHSCAKEYWIEYYTKLNGLSLIEQHQERCEQYKNLLSK